MEKTMKLLDIEMIKSMEKHGNWDDYGIKMMFDKIEDELKECLDAFFKADHKSEHRLSVELLQVAVCCIKMSRQIRERHDD